VTSQRSATLCFQKKLDNGSDASSVRYRQTSMDSIDFASRLPWKPQSRGQHLTCQLFVPAYSFGTRGWGLALISRLVGYGE